MSYYYHCSFPTKSEFLSCISCNSTIHFKCVYKAKCISSKWINKNTPSIAVLLSSANIKFTCTSCLNISISSSPRSYNAKSSQPSSLSASNNNILDCHTSISINISLSSI